MHAAGRRRRGRVAVDLPTLRKSTLPASMTKEYWPMRAEMPERELHLHVSELVAGLAVFRLHGSERWPTSVPVMVG